VKRDLAVPELLEQRRPRRRVGRETPYELVVDHDGIADRLTLQRRAEPRGRDRGQEDCAGLGELGAAFLDVLDGVLVVQCVCRLVKRLSRGEHGLPDVPAAAVVVGVMISVAKRGLQPLCHLVETPSGGEVAQERLGTVTFCTGFEVVDQLNGDAVRVIELRSEVVVILCHCYTSGRPTGDSPF
jgi:hypothetical protein